MVYEEFLSYRGITIAHIHWGSVEVYGISDEYSFNLPNIYLPGANIYYNYKTMEECKAAIDNYYDGIITDEGREHQTTEEGIPTVAEQITQQSIQGIPISEITIIGKETPTVKEQETPTNDTTIKEKLEKDSGLLTKFLMIIGIVLGIIYLVFRRKK